MIDTLQKLEVAEIQIILAKDLREMYDETKFLSKAMLKSFHDKHEKMLKNIEEIEKEGKIL